MALKQAGDVRWSLCPPTPHATHKVHFLGPVGLRDLAERQGLRAPNVAAEPRFVHCTVDGHSNFRSTLGSAQP